MKKHSRGFNAKIFAAATIALALILLAGRSQSAIAQNTFPNPGNVGIGTTSPADLLHARSTTNGATVDLVSDGFSNAERGLKILTNTGGGSTVRWKIGSPATVGGEPSGNAGTDFSIERFDLNGASLGTPFFIQRSSGNVGIGTTSPLARLDVRGLILTNNAIGIGEITSPNYPVDFKGSGAGGGTGFRLENSGTANGDDTEIIFATHLSRTFSMGLQRSTGMFTFTPNSTTLGGAGSVAIDALNGNVGIGTTSPSYTLDLRGGIMAVTDSNANTVTRLRGIGAAGSQRGALEMYDTNILKTAFYSDANDSFINGGGRFGIGTTSPDAPLHAKGGAAMTGGWNRAGSFEATYPVITLKSGATKWAGLGYDFSGGGLRFWVGATTNDVTAGAAAVTVLDSGNVGIGRSDPAQRLDVVGNINVSGGGAGNITLSGTISAKYQDVAEWVASSERLSAGTVVVLDSTKSNQVISSSQTYDTRVAGVVSEQPGIALGERSDNKVLVATTGRVRVKVDASNGPIHIGDLLVTSDIPGMAMKSEPVNLGGRLMHMPGTLIGKALEPLEKGKGEILVLLSLQ